MQPTSATAPIASTHSATVDRAAYHGAPLTVFVERESRTREIAVHVKPAPTAPAPRAAPQGEELYALSAAMF